MAERSASYFFTSESGVGGGTTYVSSDLDRFGVNIPNGGIGVPLGAKSASIECVEARVWYVSPNVDGASGVFNNNHLRFNFNGVNHDLVIPAGLYDPASLGSIISLLLVNVGLPGSLITLSANQATQMIVLNFGAAGMQINFSDADTLWKILGFNLGSFVPAAPSTAGQAVMAPNPAQFNHWESFLIGTSLCGGKGIPVNGASRNIIANIAITAAPGSQVIYRPFNPIRCDASHLIGQSLSNVDFALTDQDGDAMEMLGNHWGVVLTLRWWM